MLAFEDFTVYLRNEFVELRNNLVPNGHTNEEDDEYEFKPISTKEGIFELDKNITSMTPEYKKEYIKLVSLNFFFLILIVLI